MSQTDVLRAQALDRIEELSAQIGVHSPGPGIRNAMLMVPVTRATDEHELEVRLQLYGYIFEEIWPMIVDRVRVPINDVDGTFEKLYEKGTLLALREMRRLADGSHPWSPVVQAPGISAEASTTILYPHVHADMKKGRVYLSVHVRKIEPWGRGYSLSTSHHEIYWVEKAHL